MRCIMRPSEQWLAAYGVGTRHAIYLQRHSERPLALHSLRHNEALNVQDALVQLVAGLAHVGDVAASSLHLEDLVHGFLVQVLEEKPSQLRGEIKRSLAVGAPYVRERSHPVEIGSLSLRHFVNCTKFFFPV